MHTRIKKIKKAFMKCHITIDIQLLVDPEAACKAASAAGHCRHVAAPAGHSRIEALNRGKALGLISATTKGPNAALRAEA